MAFIKNGNDITITDTENGFVNLNSDDVDSYNIFQVSHLSGKFIINGNLTLDRSLFTDRINTEVGSFIKAGSNIANGSFEKFVTIGLHTLGANRWDAEGCGINLSNGFNFTNVNIIIADGALNGGVSGTALGVYGFAGTGEGSNKSFKNVYIQSTESGIAVAFPEMSFDNVYFSGIDYIFFEASPMFVSGLFVENSDWGMVQTDKDNIIIKNSKTNRITKQGNSAVADTWFSLVDIVVTDSFKWRGNAAANSGFRLFKTFNSKLLGDNKEGVALYVFGVDGNLLSYNKTNSDGISSDFEFEYCRFSLSSTGKTSAAQTNSEDPNSTYTVEDFNNDIKNNNIDNMVDLYRLPIKMYSANYKTVPYFEQIESFDISQDSYKEAKSIFYFVEIDSNITLTEEQARAISSVSVNHNTKKIIIEKDCTLSQLYDWLKYQKFLQTVRILDTPVRTGVQGDTLDALSGTFTTLTIASFTTPETLTGNKVIMETGGSTLGISFGFEDNKISFYTNDSNTPMITSSFNFKTNTSYSIAFLLNRDDDSVTFYAKEGYNVPLSTNDQQESATGLNPNDYSGGDELGIGIVANTSSPNNHWGSFDGQDLSVQIFNNRSNFIDLYEVSNPNLTFPTIETLVVRAEGKKLLTDYDVTINSGAKFLATEKFNRLESTVVITNNGESDVILQDKNGTKLFPNIESSEGIKTSDISDALSADPKMKSISSDLRKIIKLLFTSRNVR